MTRTVRVILIGLCVGLMAITLVAQQMPTTKKEAIAGASTVKTEELSGTVLHVDGGQVVMKMSTGELRTFNPPAGRTAKVDGRDITVADLKVGTRLKATYTTTTTPVTERTTTVGTGKVWFVSGNTVILTLPNNENRMYKVANSYNFTVDGNKKATVHDLRKGMTVSAEKIVEEPRTEIASNTTITGSAPPPPAATPAAAPAAVAETPAPAPAPRKRAEPAPAPAPEPAAAPAPAKLPKTASPFPMVGLLGLLCTGASFGLRKLRRFQ